MSDNINDIDQQRRPGNGKVFAGLILLVVGSVLLLRQFDFPYFPDWLLSWPMLIIAWGLYVGTKHNFRDGKWFVITVVGLAFLADDNIKFFSVHDLIWPVIIISVGLWLILRRNNQWNQDKWDKKAWKKDWEQKWDWRNHAGQNPPQPPADNSSTTIPPAEPTKARAMGDDYLDAVSVFGGVKKTILSKAFLGGEIVNIFGGAEIDLTMADIEGRVVIDITQVFGGTKIIVPSHWQVVSNLSAVFAGVDDKRLRKTGSGDDNKILVLEGVSIFAGVDIRSY
jgi:predicted membrane protein